MLVWDQHFPGLAAVFVWVCESLHRLLFILTVWHHNSRSRTLETAPPYQHNTVLKLCHCLIFTEIPGLPLNFKDINWISFLVLLNHCQTFFTVWLHINLNLLNSLWYKCFSLDLEIVQVADIMAPGLMLYSCSPVPSSLAPLESQCGLYALWLVTFSVAWSVYMSV